MSTRNYSGIENIKEFIINDVAPKYFNLDDVNTLNAGLLGMTTDIQSTVAEDSFNTLSLFAKEAFPAQAQLPETIFTNASFLDINEIMAKPANLVTTLFIKVSDIIEHGEESNGKTVLTLDSNMQIDIEGLGFMPDYDIIISAKPYKDDYIISAQYDMSDKNSISSETMPYIKTIRLPIDNTEYFSMIIRTHQVYRKTDIENIIDNDIINKSSFTVKYTKDLASFDAYYREPGNDKFTPLKVIPYGSTPLKIPFCFYKLIDESSYEISFTVMDSYFQPAFNSEVKIVTHTTDGSKGVFKAYDGGKITVKLPSDKYENNASIVLHALPNGASINGADRLSLEELRYKTIEKWATSGAYNTEDDLQLYLSNYTRANDTHVTFVKKRDDMVRRQFSSFSLFKDNFGNFFPTNTLGLNIYRSDFDATYDNGKRATVRAGSYFSYKDSVLIAEKIPKDTPKEELPKFVYTCPFAISVQKSPTIVSFYLNSIHKDMLMDFSYVNTDAFYQFIIGVANIKRNAIMGEDRYTIKCNLVPSAPIPDELAAINPETGKPFFVEDMKVYAAIMNSDKTNCIAYKELDLDTVHADSITTYSGCFETEDNITVDERIIIRNVMKPDGTIDDISVPMVDTCISIFVLYKDGGTASMGTDKKTFSLPNHEEYSITNIYENRSDSIDLMRPMNMIRSSAKFQNYVEEIDGVLENSYYYFLDLVPLIAYEAIDTEEEFKHYVSMLHDLHDYLSDIANTKTNNFGVDLKFYNTYGLSKNFTVGEENEQLDKVNISIHFKVAPKIGTDETALIKNLKIFIKDYIENINTSKDDKVSKKGFNAIYVSNLIQEIETNFQNIKYLRFISINNYDSSVQVIENRTGDLSELTKDERESYVPEYLTIREEDIFIDILE